MRVTFLVLVMLSTALVACGGASTEPPADSATATSASVETAATSEPMADAADMEHVHGLAVDGESLVIATHHGLYRADGDGAISEVAGARHDLMGFSIGKDGRFIASGHPAPGSDLPSNLGLVESRDGGATWETISLAGEADFHLLRVSGTTIYGGDATNGRFLKSTDGGATWSSARLPDAGVFDIAVHPDNGTRLLATTNDGLYRSRDGADTWTRAGGPTGLVVWPNADTLIVIDLKGNVSVSRDDGVSFTPAPRLDGEPIAATATRDGTTYVALADGRIVAAAIGSAWTPVVG